MQLSTYLNFDGSCEEAFGFYANCFGGEIEFIMHWEEAPEAGHAPPEWNDKVLHAALRIGKDSLMGCDVPPGGYNAPRGFGVPLNVDTTEEAERIFNALAEGGEIQMPFAKTFFAERFGMVKDRFAIPWMILAEGDNANG